MTKAVKKPTKAELPKAEKKVQPKIVRAHDKSAQRLAMKYAEARIKRQSAYSASVRTD